jgi:hypothetical protein
MIEEAFFLSIIGRHLPEIVLIPQLDLTRLVPWRGQNASALFRVSNISISLELHRSLAAPSGPDEIVEKREAGLRCSALNR